MRMWLKIGLVIIVLGLASWLGVSFYLNSYIPYVPIAHIDGQGLKKVPALNTPKHQKEIVVVLKDQTYVKWKIQNGKVMIQRKMTIGDLNRNYLWNMSIRADHPENRPHLINRKEFKKFMKED